MTIVEYLVEDLLESQVDLPKESLNYVDRLRMRELTNQELKKLEPEDER